MVFSVQCHHIEYNSIQYSSLTTEVSIAKSYFSVISCDDVAMAVSPRLLLHEIPVAIPPIKNGGFIQQAKGFFQFHITDVAFSVECKGTGLACILHRKGCGQKSTCALI